jgi:DNA repair protein RecN (Recombination protein N)
MLAQITIHNFALIEALTLEFLPGFNVLTGETGAGKSILIDALTAALGERAGPELIRAGADRALIETVFEIDAGFPALAQEWAEDGQIILSREISHSGRSAFRINGRMCTAAALRQVAGELIDIHGQHDHQSLLAADRHVEYLDAWAGPEVAEARRRVQELYAEIRALWGELAALASDERERAHRLDLYRFQAEEIDAAGPLPDEEEALSAERGRLANAERLAEAAAAARQALASEPGAVDLLGLAAQEVGTAADLDAGARPIAELLETALAAAQDAAAELRLYLENIEFNSERLAEVQERLEVYRALRRKYGDTLEEILAYREKIGGELERLEGGEERAAVIERRIHPLATDLQRAAAELYERRKAAAERFEREIAAHLADLNMTRTQFGIRLDPPDWGERLLDAAGGDPGPSQVLGRAEFVLSANPGEPLRPLARIASGGEMSRVMLALKSALAGSHPLALVFDEIDTGVGGRTAEALGGKMAQLSLSNQVLCVTHLPQIAGMASRHLEVRKQVSLTETGERTRVEVVPLDAEARVAELARMLGGSAATAAEHARQLLAASDAAVTSG